MGKRYESKLPGINQGSKYAMQDEEKGDGKGPLEKLVFNITWVRRCPLTAPVSRSPPAPPGRPRVLLACSS